MKILYVNKVSPRLGGGAELRLLEIGRRLVAYGHEIHIVCSKTEPNLPDYENWHGIHIYYLSLLPDFFFRFKTFSFYWSRYLFYPFSITLSGLVRRISPDIIVDYVTPSVSLISLLAKRYDIPCVAEVMEYRGQQWLNLKTPFTALLGLISDRLLKWFNYEKLIVISDFTKQTLEQAGFADQDIITIPCGINVENFTDHSLRSRDDKTLIVVNRLVPLKGHMYLFDALLYVREVIPEVKLRVVGDGPIRSELEMYVAQQGLEDNVTFTGRVPEEEKVSLLWQSTLFVTPSLQEGFGIVLLEAMACGLPIVAFDLPVYKELMDAKNGFLVPVKDSQTLAEKIIYLLQEEEVRQKISAYNLKYVRQFQWETMAKREEQVLKQIVASHSTKSMKKQATRTKDV